MLNSPRYEVLKNVNVGAQAPPAGPGGARLPNAIWCILG